MIDVVIVSNASNNRLKEITQTAVTTARTDGNVMVYVMEQQPKVQYEGAQTTNYTYPYNYNKCLNDGALQGTNPYIAFCNNDLVFTPGWTKITTTMQKQRVASASPICPKTAAEYNMSTNTGPHRGHDVRRLFCGWCFVWDRTLWQSYPHDEDFGFWTADNASARTIKRKGIRHILDTSVIVHHIQSATLLTLDKEKQQELTFGQIKKYNRKYKENLFNMGR